MKVAAGKYTLIVLKKLILKWQPKLTNLIVGTITSALATTATLIFPMKLSLINFYQMK